MNGNLTFWAGMRGNAIELVAPALHFFKLEPVADMPLGKLSMGWQKRVILARLLTRKSDIWLLDEPYTFLDKEGKFLLDGLIKARVDQGGSVLIASNDPIALEGAVELNLQDFT